MPIQSAYLQGVLRQRAMARRKKRSRIHPAALGAFIIFFAVLTVAFALFWGGEKAHKVRDYTDIMPLTGAVRAGTLFSATVGPAWETLSAPERQRRCEALRGRLREDGYTAFILYAEDGAPVARWSQSSSALERSRYVRGSHHRGRSVRH